ncbi:endonuclease domain-containing protein [Blastomonas fulva]|uniref:endonuclease domain-containing protein n=1 Tax=Blastomonas fulva TaxID=1550728 RepID=UPI0025A378FA|nr:DUF559 domain-containing protein [Blastomonas fulva]MDM7927135.1 DUF559 domain-containing protein [Blastomonas fulva]MDM7967411.1 DUF559 domain-containing protein [Blastomonas fulva]
MPSFTPRNTLRARSLRHEATLLEKRLWLYLNKRQRLGFKFSRQIPIGPYFSDFVCQDAKLVIEVDGDSHDLTGAYDERREAFLRNQGYRVLRFLNEDVRDHLDGVLQEIDAALGERL